jgi:hypothetical protein
LNIFIPGTPPSRWFKARAQNGELVYIRVDYNVDGSPKYPFELEKFDLGAETEDALAKERRRRYHGAHPEQTSSALGSVSEGDGFLESRNVCAAFGEGRYGKFSNPPNASLHGVPCGGCR